MQDTTSDCRLGLEAKGSWLVILMTNSHTTSIQTSHLNWRSSYDCVKALYSTGLIRDLGVLSPAPSSRRYRLCQPSSHCTYYWCQQPYSQLHLISFSQRLSAIYRMVLGDFQVFPASVHFPRTSHYYLLVGAVAFLIDQSANWFGCYLSRRYHILYGRRLTALFELLGYGHALWATNVKSI